MIRPGRPCAALLSLLVSASLPVGLVLATPAAASAPMKGGQAPGYYRMHVGQYEVTALLDGTHAFPAEKLAVDAKTGEVADLLRRQFLQSPFEGMINAFLVNMGDRLILIDTGAGNLYGKDGGGLVASMRAAGYDPAQVDDIYLTHMHEDHVGGLMIDSQPVFDHAIVHVSRQDADFWLHSANKPQVGALLAPFFDAAQKVVAPYLATGRFQTFDGAASLLPGLDAMPCPGHTPGHSCYRLQDGADTMLFWGDTVHMQPVQLPAPDVAIQYDWKVGDAVTSRKHAFDEAAKNGWWVAGAHISFPGIGHVRAVKKGEYSWVPANYTLNR